MKKTKLTALACAAALALSMPASAFAADFDGQTLVEEPVANATDWQKSEVTEVTNAGGGSAASSISMKVYVSRINVDVPIKFTVALDAAGGPVKVPANYGIKNRSAVPVQITEAAVSDLQETAAKIKLPGSTVASTNAIGSIKNGGLITPNPDSFAKALQTIKINANGAAQTLNWAIDAAELNADGTCKTARVLPLAISMENTTLTGTYHEDGIENVASVAYTVKALGSTFNGHTATAKTEWPAA